MVTTQAGFPCTAFRTVSSTGITFIGLFDGSSPGGLLFVAVIHFWDDIVTLN
ncbi:hypothetical protein FOCG_00686 [Fusarium oxysporum f. sp. radicis-lycopersici 26381]|uniref:Uncharacterized protein n=2 Tax=Fusarium oxysporum TaxID=5507 RepID=X0ADH0_FUSOX|nr:hypothetical protein FOZG_05185 [Fusarium oxysporum Fo47]EWZ98755.1 hypothetical protein FOWG_02699 [Fusarium oxysporum f. sp. lycopersici MN25]EXK41730.1 hypothetical protein FOMG_05015 [Fusarium oxysporum f. sp. melonis 26406]EXL61699.1 hypothetical protein FOCG_00686 [Fusarium oxysporum f. sp. radicis-lycopersici 26381]